MKSESSFYLDYSQGQLILPLDAQRETRVGVVLRKRDGELRKKRWLIVESFTALLNLDFVEDIQSAMTAHISFLITSSVRLDEKRL